MLLCHHKRILAVLFVGFVLSACSKDLISGKSSYNWFSLEDDIKLGNQVIGEQLKDLKKKNKKIDEAAGQEMYARVQRVTKRIAAVSHYPSFPYEAHYTDVDIVNAWCAPGGKVMVYSGLFDPNPFYS